LHKTQKQELGMGKQSEIMIADRVPGRCSACFEPHPSRVLRTGHSLYGTISLIQTNSSWKKVNHQYLARVAPVEIIVLKLDWNSTGNNSLSQIHLLLRLDLSKLHERLTDSVSIISELSRKEPSASECRLPVYTRGSISIGRSSNRSWLSTRKGDAKALENLVSPLVTADWFLLVMNIEC